MSTLKNFNRYHLTMFSGKDKVVAKLSFYNGNEFVGKIEFYAEGHELPTDLLSHPSTGEFIHLYMPMSRFADVMLMVREESPLHLFIDVVRGKGNFTLGKGGLATSDWEPIGEEEGS